MRDQKGPKHKRMTGIHRDGQKDQLRKVIISVNLPGTDAYEGAVAEMRQKLINGD